VIALHELITAPCLSLGRGEAERTFLNLHMLPLSNHGAGLAALRMGLDLVRCLRAWRAPTSHPSRDAGLLMEVARCRMPHPPWDLDPTLSEPPARLGSTEFTELGWRA